MSQHHLSGADLLHDLPGVFTVVRCLKCGFSYQNPRPTKLEMAQYYPADYQPYQVGREEAGVIGGLDLQYGIGRRVKAVMSYCRRGKVLDVGCASGIFLGALKRRGWEAWGVEIDTESARYAREVLGLSVVTGDFLEAQLPTGSFDLVTMWDVLEHMHDPGAVLREASRVLRPGGVLVINTPDIGSPYARLLGRYWAGYDLPRHTCVFSRSTLQDALCAAGFGILKITCLSGNYPMLMLSIDFWLAGRRHSMLRGTLHRLAHLPLVRAAYFPISSLVNRLGYGPSITAFASKA